MSAVYTRILADVDTIIGSAAPTFTTVVRKEIILLPGDTLPMCLIVPGEDPIGDEGFEGVVMLDYTVGIAMIWAGNLTLETGLGTVIDARAAVRHGLHVTSLPTATEVWDSDINPKPPFDTDGLAKNVDYALLEMTYRSSEQRNS